MNDHGWRRRGDGGFTLIELLVVILIIAILAAIAIPLFLRQRDKGLVAQVQSALANAKISAESYYVGNDEHSETYVGLECGLPPDGPCLKDPEDPLAAAIFKEEGLRIADTLEILITASPQTYCITAIHFTLPAGDPWKVATVSDRTKAPSIDDTCPP
jgi:prepilin-type N-terminal cleavage/methylation domain-containing protein